MVSKKSNVSWKEEMVFVQDVELKVKVGGCLWVTTLFILDVEKHKPLETGLEAQVTQW